MEYPNFTSTSCTPDGYAVFSYEKLRKALSDCECGCQAFFIRNGARANDPTQFGLKIYLHKWEAICAYERQKLAASVGLAPPVGRLIQLRDKSNKIVRWGYETCVAVRIDEDSCLWAKLYPTTDEMWNGPVRLRRALRNVSMAGLPVNDLAEETVCTPTPVKGRAKWCLGGDLHEHNVMEWDGKPVAIDFGYHCVLSSRTGKITPVYTRF